MTVLRARVLSPCNEQSVEYLEDALIVIEAGKITEVTAYDGRAVDQDLRPLVLMPGFVDAHLHFPQTRIVGAASGPLLDWLAQSTFPEEARFLKPDHAENVARIFAISLAAAGTTTAFVYGPVFPQASEQLLSVFAQTGQRAIVGPVWMDSHSPPELMLSADHSEEGVRHLVSRWQGYDNRLGVAIIPRFALSCSADAMKQAGRLAEELRIPVSTHLSENLTECQIARDLFRTDDYLKVYEDAGLLRRGAVYAHCIHLSDSEWDRFAASGAVVAHCPDSNFFLGSGRMPLQAVRERQIPMAMGTDIAAGRSFRISRILSSAYDNALAAGTTVSPEHLFWWGTCGGARSLGQSQLGQITPGFEADFIAMDVPEWATDARTILASVLFDHDAPRPRYTWVRGRKVWDRDQAGAWPWWPSRHRDS